MDASDLNCVMNTSGFEIQLQVILSTSCTAKSHQHFYTQEAKLAHFPYS